MKHREAPSLAAADGRWVLTLRDGSVAVIGQ
jgi:hypothetical protein